ncbi:DUF1816 domain-containing protein [Altericista sp. CCNU0014]|uniref:DUF1816 domain-containing protein n=1 Tax=Altericista sp. CCNU0014 TaxID=3082949 RepID=UPI00385173BE
MFESTLVVNLAFLLAAVLMVQIFIKASTRAWQKRDSLGQDEASTWGWWVELQTARPDCLYYFGPFTSFAEAEASQLGYIQDIEEEGARGITVRVKWCKPRQLTTPPDESFEFSWNFQP